MRIERRRPDDVNAETLEKLRPSTHVRFPFKDQHGSYVRVPAIKDVPILQDLANTKANLGCLVSRCQTFDLGNKPRLPDAPPNVEIRVTCAWR